MKRKSKMRSKGSIETPFKDGVADRGMKKRGKMRGGKKRR